MTNNITNRAADNIRILAAAMVEKAKSGHPGGAMGGADFINVLYSEFLLFDPLNPAWEGRDRFFLDPGHMAPMLYAELALVGKFTLEELKQLRQWGSPTPGHPEVCIQRGIENSSGPLGQGHTFAVGAAIAAKFLYAKTGNPTFKKETIYTYISDGGVQEEISQGAARLAGKLQLDNLIMFYDANDIQLSTETSVVTSEDTAAKYRAFGWEVFEIDGNDAAQIRQALSNAKQVVGKPTLIIGHCIMGKGALQADGSSYEHSTKTHGAPLGGDAYRNTIANLGGNPDEPFVVFPEVKELYETRLAQLEGIARERHKEEQDWAAQNEEKAAQLKDWFAGKLPDIDWDSIQQKPNDATRNASSTCLSLLAAQVPNMIVSSADLCNSDKTDGFIKGGATVMSSDNMGGGFLQAGVAELTMACCCIGMMLHGGVIAACGTFFVFSDYMKPAIRMAALMEVPVKFIWSHDAFRVGEDGPTHEPVEQEAQIRLMEKMKNHSGRNSMLVLRPADGKATTYCWRLAMQNTSSPSALILSRQTLEDLPDGTDYDGTARGAYIAAESDEHPDIILVGNGSEVGTLIAGARLLRKDGHKVRVVSAPSEGLFRQQPIDYQRKLFPIGSKVFGLTAGLPIAMQGFLVGAHPDSFVWGLESFGYSAPYKVLDEKFGFTAENVYRQAKKLLRLDPKPLSISPEGECSTPSISPRGETCCREKLSPSGEVEGGLPLGLASDHAGFALKQHVKAYLDQKGIAYHDYGTYSSESCNYPDFGHALARGMEAGECEKGIAICGSGEGISMTLNKHQSIRAALCWMPQIAHLARQHNDANVLVMPGRFVTNEESDAIMDEYLQTPFEGGRHENRILNIPIEPR